MGVQKRAKRNCERLRGTLLRLTFDTVSNESGVSGLAANPPWPHCFQPVDLDTGLSTSPPNSDIFPTQSQHPFLIPRIPTHKIGFPTSAFLLS